MSVTRGVRFVPEGTIGWRVVARLSRMFVTRAMTAADRRGRDQDAIVRELVNDGLGPDASVPGRERVVGMLVYTPLVVFPVAFLPAVGVALLARPFVGSLAAGDALAVVAAVLFPGLGLTIPLTYRFWQARAQRRAWQSRGGAPGERPVDRSLPRASDVVVGLALGGALSVAILVGLVAG